MREITLIIGKSGSGKDFLVKSAHEKLGLSILPSYSTREIRDGEVNGIHHEFISLEEFQDLSDKNLLIAKTFFDNNFYGASFKQLYEHDIYIIDVKGVLNMKNMINNHSIEDIRINLVEIRANSVLRFYRMIKRGGTIKNALVRLVHDKKAFKEIKTLNVKSYHNSISKNSDAFIEFLKGEVLKNGKN